jgi:hypothetical protein
MKQIALFLLLCLLAACTPRVKKQEWIQLFNGRDLADWDIKITNHPLNENYKNIFRVENGILKVSYDQLDSFRGEFGHIFYKKPFSKYILRVEYRFVGEQCPGGPEWGFRNSGAMLHSQSAASMSLHQNFPASIEAQLLGGNGVDERSTLNVCTPGTDIDFNGQMVNGHCTNSSSKTYQGDQWVSAEIIVLGDSIVHHVIDQDTVLTYTKLRVSSEMKPDGFNLPEGTPLMEGFIALQAESHSCEFRKVELLDLSGR